MNRFMQLCRLCTSDKNVSFTIFNLDSDGKSFIGKLEAIVPEIVDCKIKLPNGICKVCAVQFNEAYKFIKQCYESQITIKQHLKRLCRLCVGSINLLFTLNSMDSDNIAMSYKLEAIATEILECNETLSDAICSTCSVRLNETYKFVVQCFNSQEILKQYAEQQLGKNKIDNKTVVANISISPNEEENNSNFNAVRIKEEIIDEEAIKQNLKTDINIKVEESCIKKEIIEVDLETDTNMKIEEDLNLHSELIIDEENFDFVDKSDISSSEEPNVEQLYDCTMCNKIFTRYKGLLLHIRSHVKRKPPYKCKICAESFTRREDLLMHLIRHINERYKCEVCERGFIQKKNTEVHIPVYKNGKRHRCRPCEKAYTLPYKCKMCAKFFNENLKLHIPEHNCGNL